ncbi:Neprilysin-1 [Nymphon striatum]|nr:Neprilysin-1 [Nymphon striatum]
MGTKLETSQIYFYSFFFFNPKKFNLNIFSWNSPYYFHRSYFYSLTYITFIITSNILLHRITALLCEKICCQHNKFVIACITSFHICAHNLMQNMDKSADPCVDFYTYACGNWPKIHPLPDDAVYYDTFAVLKQDIRLKIKNLLEQPIDASDSEAIITVKNFFFSCMNESLIDERKEQPLLDLLNKLGGWPVISQKWSEKDFNLVILMAKLRLFNNDILISEGIGPDKRNSSINVIQIDQSRLGMPVPDYFLSKGRHYKAYLQYMVETAMLLGTPKKKAEFEMTEVAEFETQLANITVKDEFRRDINKIYRKISIRQLRKEVPEIDWLTYFKILIPNLVGDQEEVVTFAMTYFKKFGKLVAKTKPRVLANYLMWRFVFNRNFNLDKRFQEIQMKYYKVLYGSLNPPARWMKCTSYVNQNLGMAVGASFVKKYFSDESKEMALEMISEISESFTELLKNASWMDKGAKSLAMEKVEKITRNIGFPNFILNNTALDNYYSDVSNFQSYIFYVNNRWMTSPADVNAYYTRTQNMISFPAGILQPPLYSQFYSRVLNYGGIGVVIGHEITHGFDDKGRQFDEEGNLNEWWQNDVVEKFENQTFCFIDQYDNYVVKQVNGLRTVGENIADNGGVKQSFLAYKKWVQKNGDEQLLPGLGLTNYQLFFLNYAQVWCGSGRTEAMVYRLKTGVHTPGQFRLGHP